jgi:hypothetical protein
MVQMILELHHQILLLFHQWNSGYGTSSSNSSTLSSMEQWLWNFINESFYPFINGTNDCRGSSSNSSTLSSIVQMVVELHHQILLPFHQWYKRLWKFIIEIFNLSMGMSESR